MKRLYLILIPLLALVGLSFTPAHAQTLPVAGQTFDISTPVDGGLIMTAVDAVNAPVTLEPSADSVASGGLWELFGTDQFELAASAATTTPLCISIISPHPRQVAELRDCSVAVDGYQDFVHTDAGDGFVLLAATISNTLYLNDMRNSATGPVISFPRQTSTEGQLWEFINLTPVVGVVTTPATGPTGSGGHGHYCGTRTRDRRCHPVPTVTPSPTTTVGTLVHYGRA